MKRSFSKIKDVIFVWYINLNNWLIFMSFFDSTDAFKLFFQIKYTFFLDHF